MNEYFNKAVYPIDALPCALRDFADSVVASTQSTYDMVVPVMLATMSAAVQGVVDVRTPYGTKLPTSLFVSVIAKSGDRKSSVLNRMTLGFEEFEKGNLKEISLPGWPAQEALGGHQFLIEEATEKGVIDIFKEGAKSVFYSLDEGALLFKNLDIPNLCKRFNGDTIRNVSRTNGVVFLHDRRTALCMLTQDVTFERFMKKKGELLVESGLMPRMLISQASIQNGPIGGFPGFKFHKNSDDHKFHQRIRELMVVYAKSLRIVNYNRQEIYLDDEAANLWGHYSNNVDILLMKYPEWNDIRAFMRRSSEQVIRVAGVLQYFIDAGEKIQVWAVRAAISIVQWHMLEAKRIFGEESLELTSFRLAKKMYEYMLRRSQKIGSEYIGKSEVLRYAPSELRSADALDLAINQLAACGKISIVSYGRKTYLKLNEINHFLSLQNGVLANW
ncbi:DUF3987 domain-containing protein [Comamonas sp. Z1]|uniref:DUF3987 domain-containing protein n=1 Tax=Comamonas TaxID=283 RepID=UPI0009BCC3BD|nr:MULTISPECIES: DUF3987 domain-containing protein [Comamonas]TYK71031.1 DUF3987 domain-containing protein [Comamonas sp. Z1]TYK73370.1 DUF3987 domain-containing protein [Comamonas sp. Z3]